MPVLDKAIISQFLRTECRRQVKLGLYPDTNKFMPIRKHLEMPPRQPQRPGFRAASDLGAERETKQINELHIIWVPPRCMGTGTWTIRAL